MGNNCCYGITMMFSTTYPPRHYKGRPTVLMLGLDNAGKTSILHSLKPMLNFKSPTIGFNRETVECNYGTMDILDAGGDDKIRCLWQHYINASVSGVIFVVDSSDVERMHVAREELWRLFGNQQLRDCPFLIVGTKQDMSTALKHDELLTALGLDHKPSDKDKLSCCWKLQLCFTQPNTQQLNHTSLSILPGLDWLAQQLQRK
eukprot:NODE_169_length_1295_cov_373.896404_g165_i0.p1 GENE.NODE_169_length_1295_cov_373.896404_g165_i0~~NODE_169_length_1295_cov_373.896404_g165_i0.p1  ORF type:complete len:203 (+),score=53.51 NODE_169_length_1295_cov_373.896404_g165_i0:304-912(+)